jgi:hypothetical protein
MIQRVVVLVCLAGIACGPEPAKESHRHLAAAWCRQNIELRETCGANAPIDLIDEGLQVKCEGNSAWDWTDECGDLFWAWQECKHSVSCEEFPYIGNAGMIEGEPSPCAEEQLAFRVDRCKYNHNGKPIDHGQ